MSSAALGTHRVRRQVVSSLIAIVVAVVTAGVSSQGTRDVPTLHPRSPPREVFVNNVPIASGAVRHGVVYGDLNGLVEQDDVYVRVPPNRPRGQLCVNIDAQDGRYHGEFEYEFGTDSGGAYRVALDSVYRSNLREYRAMQLGVLAFTARSCNDVAKTYVPVSWNALQPQQVTLLVNSRGADSSVFWQTGSRWFPCSETPTTPRIVYTTACTLALPAGTGETDLMLVRQQYNARQPDIHFHLYIP
jgi:hypothetical protein